MGIVCIWEAYPTRIFSQLFAVRWIFLLTLFGIIIIFRIDDIEDASELRNGVPGNKISRISNRYLLVVGSLFVWLYNLLFRADSI